MEKRLYGKPLMSVEQFTPSEYVSACDFKWKYQGTAVEGDYINEGTYNSNSDYWDRLWVILAYTSWEWNGDTQIVNNWNTDEAASFLTNTDLGATVPSSSGCYSGGAGDIYYANLRRRFSVQDNDVYKYTNNNTVYYSGDPFERSRNYS